MRLQEDQLSLNGGLVLPNGQPAVLGSTVPRLWTPPLRELHPAEYDRNGRLITEPSSLGFDIIDFAREDLNAPLDPWQEWTVIHGFELLPDGRTRFKKLLILVARQNGKTHLCVVLTLYWMYVQRVGQILGTSTKLEYAKDAWEKAKILAKRVPELREEISHRGAIKTVNGGVVLWRADEEERDLESGSKYKIAPANEEGGRSQTNDRVILDELRHHYDYSAYDAAEPTTSVPWSSMIVGLSNAGNDRSVVLNDWRKEAIDFIETGEGDPRVGLIEYSALPTDKPNDIHALAKANPNMNRRGLDSDDLVREGQAALRIGGKKLAGFKTEKMCIKVEGSNPAIDAENWRDCFAKGDMSRLRNRIALCFDFSLDEMHATLCAAAIMPDGRVRVEIVAAWERDELQAFAVQFKAHVQRVKPKALGWFPTGPGAAHAATVLGVDEQKLADGKATNLFRPWLPKNVDVSPLRGETKAVCMGFAEQVRTLNIAHNGDPLLHDHVVGADKLPQDGGWVVARLEDGWCDGYYAAAGAVFLARTMTPSVGKPRIIVAD